MVKGRPSGRVGGSARYSGTDVIQRHGVIEVDDRGSKWYTWI